MLATFTLMLALQADPVLEPKAPDAVSLGDERVKRFVGALLGGALALAIPLAISAPSCTPAAGCGTTSFQNFTLGIMPLVAGLGAYFGHHLFGGRAEYPFAAIAAGMGSMFGMLVLAFAQSNGVAPHTLFPYVAGAAGLTAFLMAFMLDVRDDSIGDLAPTGHATGARLWATFGASIGIGIAGTFIALLLNIINPIFGLISGALFLAGVPLVSYGVHQSLDGRGSMGSAFLGLLISLAAVAIVSLPVIAITTSNRGASVFFYSAQQSALVAGPAFLALLVGPLIGLELSHTAAVRESGLQPSFSLAPVPGGAMLGGGIRF